MLLLGLAMVLSLVGVDTAAARAADPQPFSRSPAPTYQMTLVARQCEKYSDIMSNRARNDIQESLQDLGKDSVYSAGQPISPEIEEPNDPACKPLNGWQFTLGGSFTKNGTYSTVTGTAGDAGPTATVPELDPSGSPTGGDLQGATTITLNSQEAGLLQARALWVQGGTPDDPLMTKKFGKGTFGFGALRCSVDNLNGDNVEDAMLPPDARHLYCYAYYVNPEPGYGTLTIRKKISPGGSYQQTFPFASNATYNSNGQFDLAVNGSDTAETSFTRATSDAFGGPYTFDEQTPDGWTLSGISCSATNPSGTVTSTWTTSGTRASVTLGDNDHVTCVYTNAPPRDPGLRIDKVALGKDRGYFRYDVRKTGSPDKTVAARTAKEGVAVTATGDDLSSLPAGDYTITETLDTSPAGFWQLDHVLCDGKQQPLVNGDSVKLTLKTNDQRQCTFVNRFRPRGEILLHLVTEGGTAQGGFLGHPAADTAPDHWRRQQATTTQSDKPALAHGDPSGGLQLKTFELLTLSPLATKEGSWRLVSFRCDIGHWRRASRGAVDVTLAEDAPLGDCTATYRFVRSTTVDVVKVAKGHRPKPVVVDIRCTNGSAGRTVLEPGATTARLPKPLYLMKPAKCSVRETATGARPGSKVRTSTRLANNGSQKPLKLPGTFIALPNGRAYTVTVTNRYRGHPSPVCRTTGSPIC
ncbi:hypothetical protein J4573_20575 [Actinomadura barringtoniae]|uniref:SpaA-like prealbumin fold domain-containing protein n=1 Tax=Actinomadura barringtoniae TaxID=1427535 RepID=A0A939PG83_9ACTN|nr:hypothetical protein [Actinomadura barringtoniae]MBO2449508.1 hypothetical protein [Actinomadura barringtoniae]